MEPVIRVGGTFYAPPTVCPHQLGPPCAGPVGGTPVCAAEAGWKHEPARDGEILTCPWPGLASDITTGRCPASAKFRLRRYAVVVEEGLVKATP